MSPVLFFKKLENEYKNDVTNFFIICIIGIVMHLYALTNKFYNYFEMSNFFSGMEFSQNDSLGLGRWFLPVATSLLGKFSVPAISGMVFIVCMGLSACLIGKMLQINNRIYVILFGAIWMSFPGAASAFAFGVNTDAIGISILFAVLSVYVVEKIKGGMLFAIILLAMSIGIYQPYMSVSIAIIYSILLLKVLEKKFDIKLFWKMIIRYFLVLLLGFILYYVILNGVLSLNQTSLSGYHGVDEMTSFTLKGIAKGFVYSYIYFLKYYFTTAYTYTAIRIAGNIIATVIFIILIFTLSKTTGKNKLKYLLTILLIIFLPIGVTAAPFLMADRVGAGVDRYMLFSLMILWVIFLRLLERIDEISGSRKMKNGVQWIGIVACIICILGGYIIVNQSYHRMETMTKTTDGIIGRMIERMETHEDWHKELPIYFANAGKLVNENYEVTILEYDNLINLPGTEIKPWYNSEAIADYMEVMYHFPVTLVDEEQQEKLEQNELVDNMPSFPAQDSIQIVNGVMVVKVSNGEE